MATPARQKLTGLEALTVAHTGIFLAGAAWAFGGNADWVKVPLAAWGSIGALITLAAGLANPALSQVSRRDLWKLWPFAVFNLLVLASLLTPSLRAMRLDGDTLLVPQEVSGWKPSAALPSAALFGLWMFDAIYLACFNVYLTVQRRRVLRALLIFAVGNTLALAVFGTLQKLSHARGLFFGAVKSPQIFFFASFVYHNHWGAFAVLMCAAGIGLVWHYARRGTARNFLHSAAFGGLVALLLIAASVPLSTSRSCTALLALLLAGSFLQWVLQIARRRQRHGEPVGGAVAGALAGIVLAGAAVWAVDHETIITRYQDTRHQIESMRAAGDLGNRRLLYANTWRMAKDKPWFGWGMGSYPSVFTLYNTQEPNPIDHLPAYYHDAHNDWLQSLAEHGLIGTALLGLCALVPLLGLRRRQLSGSIPGYILGGCALIVLYAWIEFPFGNVAVVLCWWLIFFCALRYARLTRLEHRQTPPPGA